MILSIFPENVSTYGAEIDSLFYTITLFAGIAFFISIFLLIYPLIKYRYKEGRVVEHNRGITHKQLKWVYIGMTLLACTDFYMLVAEHSTWVKIEEHIPEQVDFHVAVTGRQWNWMFTYPGKDGVLYTADDVIVDQQNSELHLPVNKNIVFDLKAIDVLHSFFIPVTRLKQDVLPGRTISRWVNITKIGTYELNCAEICGVMHAKMRNFIVVEEEADFNKYINELYSK